MTVGMTPWRDRAPVREHYQKKLNEVWPRNPRALPERSPRIPVWVRVVWAEDGEEWIAGKATRWDRNHVQVWFLLERRAVVPCIWVVPADVRRRVMPE